MFTVRRFGIDGTLARTLVCTNMIESMFDTVRTTTRNVKRWQDKGDMRRRWAAAGMLEAESRFGRSEATGSSPSSRPPWPAMSRPLSHPLVILKPTNQSSLHDNTGTTTLQRLQHQTGHPPQGKPPVSAVVSAGLSSGAVEQPALLGKGRASHSADKEGIGNNEPIRPECPGVEGDRNLFVRTGQSEDHQVIANVILISGDRKVVPVGGEHCQQLASFVLGEVEDPDRSLELVPSSRESLAVDCPSTSRGASDEPRPLQRY